MKRQYTNAEIKQYCDRSLEYSRERRRNAQARASYRRAYVAVFLFLLVALTVYLVYLGASPSN